MPRALLGRPFFEATAEGNNNGGGGAGDDAAVKAKADADAKTKADAEAAKAKAQGDDDGAAKAKQEALEKSNKELKAKLEAFEKAKKEEEDKQKTAEQKLAEASAELAKAKREALVEKVRRANGFSDKVYDVVNAAGETEEEIKAAFEGYKATLDEFVKAQGGKAGVGGGTQGGKKPADKSGEPDKRPYLVRMGIVKADKAV